MVSRPAIFISSTSDLRSARQLVANVLLSMGYEPVWQDIEPTEGGELLEVLRERMAPCSMMIQLVGKRYGGEPPEALRPPEFGRVSFTQYEALYFERTLGRKVIYHFLDANFPADPTVSEGAELTALQDAYRARIESNNRLHQAHIDNLQSLELSIRRISDDLGRLRVQADARHRATSRKLAWLLGGVAALIAVVLITSASLRNRQSEQARAIKSDTAAIRQSIDAIVPRLLAEAQGKDQQIDRLRTQLEDAVRRLAVADASGDKAAKQKLEQLRAGGDPKLLGAFLDEQIAREQQSTVELLHERAAVAYVTGEIDRARQCLDAILALRPDDLDAINALGRIFTLRGDLPEAERQFTRILQLAPTDESWRATALGNLGAIASMRGDPAAAERLYREALEINRKLGRSNVQANNLTNLGRIAAARGDLDAAEKLHRQSLEINGKLGRREGQAISLGNLAEVAQARGDLDTAEKLYDEANEVDNLPELRAVNLSSLGGIAYLRGDLATAERLQHESLKINRSLGRSLAIASNLDHLGLIATARGDLGVAEEFHVESLQITRKSGRRTGEVTSLINLGRIALIRDDLDSAEKFQREALQIAVQIGETSTQATSLSLLGMIAVGRGNAAEARRLWTQSLELFERAGQPHMAEKVQKLLSGLPKQ
jgi:tetratricopeptide (TPR) repeat protein